MLKRKDLVQQFDLVVKQEIKNHNDAVLAGNITINNFRKQLGDQSKKIDENHAQFLSVVNRLESEILHQKNLQAKLIKDTTASLSDLSLELMKHIQKSDDWMSNISTNYVKKTDFIDQVNIEMQKSVSVSNELKNLNDSISHHVNILKLHVKESIKKAIEKLESKPSEALDVKKHLEKKLECHIVDVKGVTRQLKVNHKACFIIEKKLENIYTLIERLKKG